ncbi:hypothetical protein [Pedobacter hartonius]|uniref:Uncharacterized protein n=1 Tax=Pedobacter hartonius TaxID=425514 RepID=A0A1H3W5H5_9SPHI|nr:hypothetical protein [Pedobacter hartonius]SDZ82327.1 hypothetical protein SAMN05443550_101107 [Pedobacter hartonius]
MGLFKTIFISAAIYGAYKFLTEPDVLGNTRLDKIKEQMPELIEKAKLAKEDIWAGRMPQI